MTLPRATADALSAAGIPFELDLPLARRVWWRTGGPADAWVEVSSLGVLQTVQRVASETNVPLTVLGNGSNVLVADSGIRGLVIQLTGELAETNFVAPFLSVGAGLKLAVLLARGKANGWTGLACFAGIPGTVGGAVRMNAGSSLGETGDHLADVTFVDPAGEVYTWPKERLQLSYRTCILPKGAIIASARFECPKIDAAEESARIQAFIERRKATQPLDFPSCGSTFRNPPGDAAGRLIEAAGLKGYTLGAAQISTKHANFILNLGGATAKDIRAVLEHAQREVHSRFGVDLEPEVHFVGAW